MTHKSPHNPTPFCDCAWCKMDRDPLFKEHMVKAVGCSTLILFGVIAGLGTWGLWSLWEVLTK